MHKKLAKLSFLNDDLIIVSDYMGYIDYDRSVYLNETVIYWIQDDELVTLKGQLAIDRVRGNALITSNYYKEYKLISLKTGILLHDNKLIKATVLRHSDILYETFMIELEQNILADISYLTLREGRYIDEVYILNGHIKYFRRNTWKNNRLLVETNPKDVNLSFIYNIEPDFIRSIKYENTIRDYKVYYLIDGEIKGLLTNTYNFPQWDSILRERSKIAIGLWKIDNTNKYSILICNLDQEDNYQIYKSNELKRYRRYPNWNSIKFNGHILNINIKQRQVIINE